MKDARYHSHILQSFGNVEYFIDRLQIWERGLAKIVAPSFKNLPDRLSKPAALFSSMFLRIFTTLSSETKVNLNLVFGSFNVLL